VTITFKRVLKCLSLYTGSCKTHSSVIYAARVLGFTIGTCSVDIAFDDSWKEEVDKKVCEFSNLPTVCVQNVSDREEIASCVRKNNKTGGSDGLVGELLKYGGSGMVELLQQLFTVIWCEDFCHHRGRRAS
jgi:hypothetical protein